MKPIKRHNKSQTVIFSPAFCPWRLEKMSCSVMNYLKIGLITFSTLSVISCSTESRTIASAPIVITKGYPVYKFLNLSGIDQRNMKKAEEHLKNLLGEGYKPHVKYHQRMVDAGFDQHELLSVIRKDGTEVDIYIQQKDFEKLWKINPHDLSEKGRSHFVTIEYQRIMVEGEGIYNRAKSFKCELVEHEPTIRK